MKCRGYSKVEADNRTLQMQVHHMINNGFKGEDNPRPIDVSAMAVTALLAYGSMAKRLSGGGECSQ
jgi:hypothetical protein